MNIISSAIKEPIGAVFLGKDWNEILEENKQSMIRLFDLTEKEAEKKIEEIAKDSVFGWYVSYYDDELSAKTSGFFTQQETKKMFGTEDKFHKAIEEYLQTEKEK